MAEWYQNKIRKPMEKLNPKKIEAFYNVMKPFVNQRLEEMNECFDGVGFCILQSVGVYYSETRPENRAIFEKFLFV